MGLSLECALACELVEAECAAQGDGHPKALVRKLRRRIFHADVCRGDHGISTVAQGCGEPSRLWWDALACLKRFVVEVICRIARHDPVCHTSACTKYRCVGRERRDNYEECGCIEMCRKLFYFEL